MYYVQNTMLYDMGMLKRKKELMHAIKPSIFEK